MLRLTLASGSIPSSFMICFIWALLQPRSRTTQAFTFIQASINISRRWSFDISPSTSSAKDLHSRPCLSLDFGLYPGKVQVLLYQVFYLRLQVRFFLDKQDPHQFQAAEHVLLF